MAKQAEDVDRAPSALGLFVERRLAQLGLSQSELALRTGIGRTAISALVVQHRAPKSVEPSQLKLLADVLAVSVEELLALWTDEVVEVRSLDERTALVQGFVLANSDLSNDQVRAALDVAAAAARLARR